MTIQNALNEFLIDQQIRGNSSYTISFYTRCVGYFIAYVGSDRVIDEITLSDLKNFYMTFQSRNLSTVTVQSYFRAVRAFLSWCYKEEYMSVCLPDKFKLPKAKRYTIDVLTDTEIRNLFEVFSQKTFLNLRNCCICSLMIDSGLRLNEVSTLQLSNVHIPESYVIVDGKGNKQRIVPIGLHTKKALLRYLAVRPAFVPQVKKQNPLFVSDPTTPITNGAIKQLFRKLKTRAEIPRLKAHLLRHTFATRYLEHGGDIYSLQQILGHTSLEMVKRYVHTMPRKTVVFFTNFSPLDNLDKK